MNRIMHDTIQKYMNRFKMTRHKAKSSCDTIQIYLIRIKILETDFCEKKRPYPHGHMRGQLPSALT